MEVWINLQGLGFSRYSVSDCGSVRRDSTGLIMKPTQDPSGRLRVGLYHDDRERQTGVSLALLVAEMFLPGKPNNTALPIHLDGNNWNCDVSNLIWRGSANAKAYRRNIVSY